MKDKADLINKVIEQKKYKSYLELGVGEALETISKIKCDSIDSVDSVSFKENFPTFVGTTDSFFEQNTKKYDVIYIDADHSYEAVKRDFENAVKCLNKNGIIFMHDIGPMDRNQTAAYASGTAYKAFIEIRGNKKYDAFSFEFLNTDVLGMVKIRKNPSVLKDYTLDYEFYEENRGNILQKKTFEGITNLI